MHNPNANYLWDCTHKEYYTQIFICELVGYVQALTANFQEYNKHDFAKPAVLYILQHIQPHLKQKTASKHYLQNSFIDLCPDEQPDLGRIVSSEIEYAANQVSFKSDWFTIDKYMELWNEYFSKFLTEHIEIQKPLQTILTNFPSDWIKQLMLISESLNMLSSILRNAYDKWHRKLMAEFCDSNLPLELYSLYNLAYIEKISVIRTFADDLVRLQSRLYRVRSDKTKIKKEFFKFEEQYKATSDMLIAMSRSELVLEFYLKSNNAKEMKDLFRPIPLTIEGDAEGEFKNYMDVFKIKLFELTNFINKKKYLEDIALSSPKSESFKNFGEKLNQIILKNG